MTYYIIALSDDHPDKPADADMYWCGYVSQGRTHSWVAGDAGVVQAIGFVSLADAQRAGVSGPNVPNPGLRPQPQLWANRGVKFVKIET